MTTVGRWSPSKVRGRIIDGTWVSETGYAMELIRPTSVLAQGTGSSASIVGLGSVDFSTCTAVSLNGVFSAEYDNYMIVYNFNDSTTADSTLYNRMRLSGTDNNTANSYVQQRITANSTTVSAARFTGDEARSVIYSDSLRSGAVVYIYGPNLAQPTAARTVVVGGASSAFIEDYAWTHNQSTAYDGISSRAGSGTISGNVAVYGLRG